MLDFEKALKEHIKGLLVREYPDNSSIVAPMIFHYDSQDSTTFRFRVQKNGNITLGDNRRTFAYIDECTNINLKDYSKKIQRILDVFGVEREGNEILMKSYLSYDDNIFGFFIGIGRFIQAITLIANIDL